MMKLRPRRIQNHSIKTEDVTMVDLSDSSSNDSHSEWENEEMKMKWIGIGRKRIVKKKKKEMKKEIKKRYMEMKEEKKKHTEPKTKKVMRQSRKVYKNTAVRVGYNSKLEPPKREFRFIPTDTWGKERCQKWVTFWDNPKERKFTFLRCVRQREPNELWDTIDRIRWNNWRISEHVPDVTAESLVKKYARNFLRLRRKHETVHVTELNPTGSLGEAAECKQEPEDCEEYPIYPELFRKEIGLNVKIEEEDPNEKQRGGLFGREFHLFTPEEIKKEAVENTDWLNDLKELVNYSLVAVVSGEENVFTFSDPPRIPEAFLLANPVPSNNGKLCIDKQLIQCQNGFNYMLNITTMADWSNPDTLIYAINKYYAMGVDGVLSVCKARTMFAQCLGNSYDVCLSTVKFINSGKSLSDAQKYIGIMRELEFQCNGGLLQTVGNWDCIMGMKKRGDNTYQECKNAFYNATNKDPSVTCNAAKTFSNCARAPYYLVCGADASWWECERVRVSLSLDKQCPTNVCEFHKFMAAEKSPLDKFMEHGEKLARTQHVRDVKVNHFAQHAAHMNAKYRL